MSIHHEGRRSALPTRPEPFFLSFLSPLRYFLAHMFWISYSLQRSLRLLSSVFSRIVSPEAWSLVPWARLRTSKCQTPSALAILNTPPHFPTHPQPSAALGHDRIPRAPDFSYAIITTSVFERLKSTRYNRPFIQHPAWLLFGFSTGARAQRT
jgi:hypothetical protein